MRFRTFSQFSLLFFSLQSTQADEASIPWGGLTKATGEVTPVSSPAAMVKTSKKKTKRSARHAGVSFSSGRAPASERDRLVPISKPSAVRSSQLEPVVPESPQEEETRLTGNWRGVRKSLSESGVDLGLIYRLEFNRNFSGGLQQQSVLLGDIDFKTSLNLEKLLGWKGTSAFIYVLNTHGKRPSLNVGDYQGTSNIETVTAFTKVYEAWLQQVGFDDKVSVLLGLHDLNSEFYVTDAAGLFFNSSFGVGKELSQTGLNGPSIFPSTSVAARLRVEPTKNFYIQTGLFDALAGNALTPGSTLFRLKANDGLLYITEAAAFTGKDDPAKLYSKYTIGIWGYTHTFENQVNQLAVTNNGGYILGEQSITHTISVFARYGVASGESNRVSSDVSGGIVFTGILPHREKDRFGIDFTQAKLSNEYKEAQHNLGVSLTDSETAYEINYRLEVIPGVALQPDFQIIHHAGMDPSLHDSYVGAVRMELNF